MCLVYQRRSSCRNQSHENTRRQTNPVRTAPPTKGDAILVEHAWLAKKKTRRLLQQQRGKEGNIAERSPRLRTNIVVAEWKETNKNGVSFNKKLDGWNHLALPLPAETRWPLFGQQADTFHRAFKLGRWATTNTTPWSTNKKRESQLLRTLPSHLCETPQRLVKSPFEDVAELKPWLWFPKSSTERRHPGSLA